MNQISIFDFEDRSVRTVAIDGDPWFVGRDVCRALDIKNESDALGRLDTDERHDGVAITDPIGRKQTPVMISEAGVYRLVFTSRSEVAERFKRWLAHEVLPAIRRTGRFEVQSPSPPMLEDDAINDLHRKMMIIREARMSFGVRAARDLARSMSLPMQLPSAGAGAIDHVATFADDALVREIGPRIAATDLYQAYVRWCGDRRVAPISATLFGRRMSALGLGRLKTGGRVVYTDVDVATGDSADECHG